MSKASSLVLSSKKGVARGGLGDVKGAVAAFDEVVDRFGTSVQGAVARALLNKARFEWNAMHGRAKELLAENARELWMCFALRMPCSRLTTKS